MNKACNRIVSWGKLSMVVYSSNSKYIYELVGNETLLDRNQIMEGFLFHSAEFLLYYNRVLWKHFK